MSFVTYIIQSIGNAVVNTISYFSYIIYNDAPEPWQIGFQDGASPSQEGITELHDTIFFYLVVILFGVMWMLSSVIVNFNNTKAPIVHKYANHGTLIELIWTITPALILIAIAFPSFKLLYIIDEPLIIGCTIPFDIFNSCSAITLYSNNVSTLRETISNNIKKITPIPINIQSQLVGHLLGDGNMRLNITSVNPAFMFSQGFSNFDYTWHVYQKLSHYCSRLPSYHNYMNSKGKYFYSNQVTTRNYPCIETLYLLFYKYNGYKIVKTVTWDIIPYMNPIALAYWTIDDGSITSQRYNFNIHTEGFTFQEVYILAGMLHYLFNIHTTVQNNKMGPRLYIKGKSIPTFVSLVKPYYHESMIYKLNFKNMV